MKKQKSKYIDDGHTIYSMDGLNKERKENLSVTKKEKHAIIKAAFTVYFPRLLLILLAFSITCLLLYFWLK